MYKHVKCGGEIDRKTRTCQKCGRHWNPIMFWLTPREIRPMDSVVSSMAKDRGDTSHAGWADKLPMVGLVAGFMPNWPRWIRISTVVGISVSAIIIVIWRIVS